MSSLNREAMAMTASGKVRKHELRARARGQRARFPGGPKAFRRD